MAYSSTRSPSSTSWRAASDRAVICSGVGRVLTAASPLFSSWRALPATRLPTSSANRETPPHDGHVALLVLDDLVGGTRGKDPVDRPGGVAPSDQGLDVAVLVRPL